jgi:hypothetical protein
MEAINEKTRESLIRAGLEIAGCQWPKAGHILEMARQKQIGTAKSKKKWQVKFYRYISFHLLATTHICQII